jgi:hypothetical protein
MARAAFSANVTSGSGMVLSRQAAWNVSQFQGARSAIVAAVRGMRKVSFPFSKAMAALPYHASTRPRGLEIGDRLWAPVPCFRKIG